jgi:hypothetical protein
MSAITGSSTARPFSSPIANGGASGSFVPKQSVIPSAALPGAAPTTAAPPGSTVTLSDQARSAIDNASTASNSGNAPLPLTMPASTPAASGPSTYESMKRGIVAAVDEVEDVASDSFHAVVNGVETAVSSANSLVRGVLDSPFVVISKICDAAGAAIDEI